MATRRRVSKFSRDIENKKPQADVVDNQMQEEVSQTEESAENDNQEELTLNLSDI